MAVTFDQMKEDLSDAFERAVKASKSTPSDWDVAPEYFKAVAQLAQALIALEKQQPPKPEYGSMKRVEG